MLAGATEALPHRQQVSLPAVLPLPPLQVAGLVTRVKSQHNLAVYAQGLIRNKTGYIPEEWKN